VSLVHQCLAVSIHEGLHLGHPLQKHGVHLQARSRILPHTHTAHSTTHTSATPHQHPPFVLVIRTDSRVSTRRRRHE
jgi:hypothetical protein